MTLDENPPLVEHRRDREAADLDEFMADLGPLEDAVVDPLLAERMVRRVVRLRRQLDTDADVAKAEQARIADWYTTRAEATEKATEYLVACLRGYHETRLADDPKAKSIHLPSGTLKARRSPDRVEVDVTVFLAAEPGAEWVRVKTEPDKPVILQHVKQTGELPAGVTLVPGEVRYTIEPGDQ